MTQTSQAPFQPRHWANRLTPGPAILSFYILSQSSGVPYMTSVVWLLLLSPSWPRVQSWLPLTLPAPPITVEQRVVYSIYYMDTLVLPL